MGIAQGNLPFPRGGTWGDFGNAGLTLSDTVPSTQEGMEYTVQDTVNGTLRPVTLVVLKNDTGAAITVAKKFLKFSTTSAKDIFRRCAGYNDAAGGLVVAMDDAYTVGDSIPDDDLFYAVVEGPVQLTTEASSVNLAAGNAVASDASAFVNGAVAAAGEFVAGTMDVASTTTGETVLVYMAGNRALPPAA